MEALCSTYRAQPVVLPIILPLNKSDVTNIITVHNNIGADFSQSMGRGMFLIKMSNGIEIIKWDEMSRLKYVVLKCI